MHSGGISAYHLTVSTEIDKLLEEADKRLKELEALPPGAFFDQLVSYGFIDRQGRLTTLLGGEAPMEPHARPPVTSDD